MNSRIYEIDHQTIRVSVSRDEHYSARVSDDGQRINVKGTRVGASALVQIWTLEPMTDVQIREATPRPSDMVIP
jgi:hypothetical protein